MTNEWILGLKEKPHIRQLNGEEEIQNLRPHPLTLYSLEIPAWRIVKETLHNATLSLLWQCHHLSLSQVASLGKQHHKGSDDEQSQQTSGHPQQWPCSSEKSVTAADMRGSHVLLANALSSSLVTAMHISSSSIIVFNLRNCSSKEVLFGRYRTQEYFVTLQFISELNLAILSTWVLETRPENGEPKKEQDNAGRWPDSQVLVHNSEATGLEICKAPSYTIPRRWTLVLLSVYKLHRLVGRSIGTWWQPS